MEDILEDTTMVEVILGVFDYNQFIFATFCLIFSPFLSLKGFLIDQLMLIRFHGKPLSRSKFLINFAIFLKVKSVHA